MKRTHHMTGYTVGMTDQEKGIFPSNNHYHQAAQSAKTASEVKRRGLTRVAGNVFINHSTRDFWSVKGGKVVRLTMTEVDNGETLRGAPRKSPGTFLNSVLDDLTF